MSLIAAGNELHPYPLAALIRRMFGEWEERGAIFDLPQAKFFRGSPDRDLSVPFHGFRAATPFGPAAGPHSQMAQNLVLAWLGGARILELKTVQIQDQLEIPRPCIDLRTIGFNVEWSQELTLEESLREYVKGAMLVEMLKTKLGLPAGFADTIWDMSVGYDLQGIRSEPVMTFIRGLMDASRVTEELRPQIPDEFAEFRDLDFPTQLSRTLTLSTFHGCPPDEIERILDFLLREVGLHVIVKLNPVLQGPAETRRLLNDVLGYELTIPDTAFENDTRWDQAAAFVERLRTTAGECGLGFGVKLTNTLIAENPGDFLPGSERERYVSGQPLHVLAMNLVGRFRRQFGADLPISFSAGIDRGNFPDAVALGLVPVTVCSDLLRPGGYARSATYLQELDRRMADASARNVDEWIIRAYGNGAAALEDALGDALGDSSVPPDGADAARGTAALDAGTDLRAAVGDAVLARWRAAAVIRNTETYVDRVTADPRYRSEKNEKPPRKIGSRLELLDCVTCDKCIPVCPNDANFALMLPPDPIPVTRLRWDGGKWVVTAQENRPVEKKHQIANFTDFCNECGNCDVFCPEDGGPYVLKPRFYGSLAAYRDQAADGLFVGREAGTLVVYARAAGAEMRLERRAAGDVRWSGPGFDVTVDLADPLRTIAGSADAEVDLGWAHLLDRIADALLEKPNNNWVGALLS